MDAIGVEVNQGYFVQPTLLQSSDPAESTEVHRLEVFGPVATIMPYAGTPAAAADLLRRGQGSLVSSAYGDDVEWIGELITGLAPAVPDLLEDPQAPIPVSLRQLFLRERRLLSILPRCAFETVKRCSGGIGAAWHRGGVA